MRAGTGILTQIHLTERRAEWYPTLGTEATLAAHAGDWTHARAVADGAEGRELRAAVTVAEWHGIQQFYAWVRLAHIVGQ